MEEFLLGGKAVPPGARVAIDLPVGNITSHAPVILPVQVVRGKKEGPCLLVCGCLHGDELNGAEIVRRLLRSPSLQRLRGTLLAVPVLNLPAFLGRTRYLPDRRDLNRCFPGAASGSLAARLA
ncbi:MAG: succinylglutamate desuccinylase/aspartoacylase family protein, partial [Akkermansiaceae bacterium]|nr:succinylglutamate desuccinylase/aspartoacylase family protein [Akkermansiaceae bacterium]